MGVLGYEQLRHEHAIAAADDLLCQRLSHWQQARCKDENKSGSDQCQQHGRQADLEHGERRKGIKRREGARLNFAAMLSTAGIITMTTGVLLMNGEISNPTMSIANSRRRSLLPAISPIHCPKRSIQPVLLKAPLMINRQATVIGALLLKTPSTCFGLNMPNTSSNDTAAITATSALTHSRTKAAKSTSRIAPTITA